MREIAICEETLHGTAYLQMLLGSNHAETAFLDNSDSIGQCIGLEHHVSRDDYCSIPGGER